jgi:hypothetical protein
MDVYLSRRIKNWATWQQPDPSVRERLLLLALAETGRAPQPRHIPTPVLSILKWIGTILNNEPPEINPFAYRLPSQQIQFAYLNLDLIWQTGPLRYA